MQYEHMMITTHRTFAEWSSVFGEAEMTTELPDRLAASRPHMNFVPPKALAQQDAVCRPFT